MGVTIGDFNGDGRLDIFKTNFSDDTSTLYRNNGDGTFDDVTFAAGLGLHTHYLGWGTDVLRLRQRRLARSAALNGHVYPEVDKQHLGSTYHEPRILYHNNGNGTFTDISADSGSGITAMHAGRGLAIGDLWNDGRLSAVVSNMNDHAQPAGKPGAFAQSLDRDPYRRDKVESRRHRRAHLRESGSRILVDEVRSGASYGSQSDMRVHFGLGPAAKIDWVQIRWLSGVVEQFENVRIDTIQTLKEGSGKPLESQPRKAARLKP